MKIILAAWPAYGHLNPILGVARILVADGHEVVVYTGSAVRGRVEAVGARLEVLPAEVDYDLSDVDACFPERVQLTGADRLLYDFDTLILGSMAPAHRGLRALLDRFPADVIIAESLFTGVVPLLLGDPRSRPPVIVCGISYLMLDRDDRLPNGPGLPFAADPAVAAGYREHSEMARRVNATLQPLYHARLAALGLVPEGDFPGVIIRQADLFLQGGVAEFEYPRADLPGTVRFVGCWPSPPAMATRPAWAAELDRDRRVVLVTQGTAANGDLNNLVLPTIRALADRDDLLVLATSGGRDISAFAGTLPSNARLETFLPFDWLLPKVDVLVTNGGFGTAALALAAGVPMVVAGTTEDKAEVGARVAWSGVGIDLKTDTPSEDMLRSAVTALLQNAHFGHRAEHMAAAFAGHDCAAIVRDALLALDPAAGNRAQKDADVKREIRARHRP